MTELTHPLALLAELTHRCPLACPYCSNPTELDRRADELDTANWIRVFQEAAELGVLHLHLSGGEPGARGDLVDLVGGAVQAGLYTNLITSGIGLDRRRLEQLSAAGLDHVQLSIQDTNEAEADRISGYPGSHKRKRAFAAAVGELRLPLTINVVLHRGNLPRIREMTEEAIALGARRIELAHTQYYGWGLLNRTSLLPTRSAVDAARATVAALRDETRGTIVIDYVLPDYFARYPKPCVNGWGRQSLNVTPRGRVLPCHAAESIPGLEFWNVRDRSLEDIWEKSPAFNAFRGTDWMQEPCRSCARRDIDFGGCRCQALALTGDARNTDPVCILSPLHETVTALADRAGDDRRSDGRSADDRHSLVMRGRQAAIPKASELA